MLKPNYRELETSQDVNSFKVGIKIKFYNDRLRQARIDMGYDTVTKFCEEYDIPYGRYLSCETMNDYPSLEFAFRLSEIFRIPPDELFPDFLKKIGKKKLKNIYLKRDFIYTKNIECDITELKNDIAMAVNKLDEREKKIILFRWGLNDRTPKTLKEASDFFNISPERVRKIESRAIRKLRHPSRTGELKKYLVNKSTEEIEIKNL